MLTKLKKSTSLGRLGLRSVAAILAVLVMLGCCLIAMTGCSSANRLYILAYGDYFDTKTLDKFEAEHDVKVIYDSYAAPEDLYAKLISGATHYDVICAGDYIIEKLIGEDRLAVLDLNNIPNYANIDENLIKMTENFDNGGHSVPHFWGTLGILYNTKNVPAEDVSTWKVLFDKKYSGQIIMPNSERDAMFIALRLLGYDVNTKDEAQLTEAAEMLKTQYPDVQAYLLDEAARNKCESENADIAVIYNGEAYLAMENNSNLDYIVPNEGTYLWVDSWAIPAQTTKKALAESFIDYMCSEEVALANFEYIYYSTPNAAVTENLDSEILDIEAIFPDESIFENGEVFNYLGTETEELYSQLWRMIKTA